MGRAHPGADAAAGGPALTAPLQPARQGLQPLADDVAQRCRAGLGAAASALYGGEDSAIATARGLRARTEHNAARWPWLPGLCYAALEPLGVTFDRDDRVMMVAGKALVGLPVRPERVAEASRRLRQPEPPAPTEAPDPALATAVDRFWTRLTRLAQRLGEAVRAGDEETVAELLRRAQPKLSDSATAVQQAAERAVGGSPAPAEAARPREAAPTPARPASAEQEAAPAEPDPEGEEDDSVLGPERPYAPMIFVGVALVVALVLLLVVALGGF